jgi:oligopeptide/dipeptide ABC transporter ATP-binding protein
MNAIPLLSVANLTTAFDIGRRSFAAVKDFCLSVEKGQTVGIVGESGSGKTMASLSILRLLPNQGHILPGSSIRFEGREFLSLDEEEMSRIRGKDISMIFQDPMMSLDPVFTAGYQIAEAICIHEQIAQRDAERRALQLLRSVGIASPERVFTSYPFELSGGMCQRVMIAIALSCNPKLLIADEPTTALDVTVQAQILDLLRKIRDEYGMGIVLITHDLGVVAEMADRVVVMYAGRVMEEASTKQLFGSPIHPYTVGLMRSIPQLDSTEPRLRSIMGTVPDISSMPKGCRFCTRCQEAEPRCAESEPEMCDLGEGHRARCWKADSRAARGARIG